MQCTAVPRLVQEVDAVEFNRQAAATCVFRYAWPIFHGHWLVIDSVKPAGRPEGIRQLTPHIRDFRNRQEGRHREQREQRQNPALQPPRIDQYRPGDDDREATETRRDLQQGGLELSLIHI